MRIDHIEQVLGETGELGIELQLHACREKGEPLQQTLHIGICAFEPFEAQAARDLGEFLREFGSHFAYVLELALVIAQQPWIHQRTAAAL